LNYMTQCRIANEAEGNEAAAPDLDPPVAAFKEIEPAGPIVCERIGDADEASANTLFQVPLL
jgi:hypothetical protein